MQTMHDIHRYSFQFPLMHVAQIGEPFADSKDVKETENSAALCLHDAKQQHVSKCSSY